MMKLAWMSAAVLALTAAPALADESQAPDYSQDTAWLCKPDRIDACATDQSLTVIEANGAMRAEPLVPVADRPFDCFYVYPTVSNDPGGNSDMIAGAEELSVAHAQAARFRKHCRVFAPLYRQVTLTALRNLMAGGTEPVPDRALGFGDVQAAWKSYLANDNDGRGVVLIGHSQGSGMLGQLLKTMTSAEERAKVVSALLIGTNVERSANDPAVGDFAWMPPCASAEQHGCVVTYVTFRDNVPPPAGSRFGRAQNAGMQTLCVNPAALLGKGAEADAIFSTEGVGTASRPMTEWVVGEPLPTTNFVSVPGLIEASCANRDGANYLAVTVRDDPADRRVDDITGDVFAGGMRLDDWGLHLLDMPVVMGDLVELTRRQHASWAAAR